MHRKLSILMLISFVLAIIFAKFFPDIVVSSKFLGDSFIRLLKGFVPFLIFGTITFSIASFDAVSKIGKIVPLTLFSYIVSTLVAISFALFVGSYIDFGLNNYDIQTNIVNEDVDIGASLSVLAINPKDFLSLLIQGNPFAIMISSVVLGMLCRIKSRYTSKTIYYLSKVNNFVIVLTNYIMLLAPLAIFSLLGNLLIQVDNDMIYSLFRFVISSIFIFLIYLFFFYGSVVNYLGKVSPISFFKHIKDALLFAFFSSSSAATMPLTLRIAENDLGLNKEISSFVIPIGVTVNMDGSAIYLGLAALFVGQILGINFSINEYLIICLTATIGSIGAAGVPSVALVMMTIVFSSVGIPLEAIAIIAGVDRLLDMFRTSINVAGDLTIATIVNRIINK